MSNKQKKSNGKRRRQFNPDRGTMAINALLHRGDVARLDDMEIMNLNVAMYAALDDVSDGFSPVSYNVLTHFFRVASYLAQDLNAKNFAKVCETAKDALSTYHHLPACALPPELKQPILDMLDALCAFLPEVPRGLYHCLDDASRKYVQEAIVCKFVELEDWQRQAAYAMLAHDKRIDLVALDVGKTTAQVADATLSVGAMLHTLTMDSKIRFPVNLQELMAVRGEFEQQMLLLYTTQSVMEKLEAKRAA